MKPLICKLPMLPLTANERATKHWGVLDREKQDITLLIPMCQASNRQPKNGPKRLVEVVFMKPAGTKAIDPDALDFRCKSINDALQRRKWIADDDKRHIDLLAREEWLPKGERQKGYTIISVSLADVGELKGAA